tara:strand:+ start:133 stop:330 length:198 start_codon:yes stop_codon:yes gene_type:complete
MVDKIIETTEKIMNDIHNIVIRVGRLDDMYESDLIDHRVDMGAYQYLRRAINRLDEYIYEVKSLE